MRKLTVLLTSLMMTGAMAITASAVTVSQAAVLFLMISPGARPGGMGESFVAVADDATATWWNTAGLGFQRGLKVSAMHSQWLPQFGFSDLYYDFLGSTMFIPSLGGTIGGNIVFLNMGSQPWTDAVGNSLGTIESYDLAFSLSYGTQLSPNLAVGIGGKFIYSNLATGTLVGSQEAQAGKAGALDLGVLYKARITPAFSTNLGASLTNMGNKIFYADQAQADPLPTNLKMGYSLRYSFDAHNEVSLNTDLNKPMYHPDGSPIEGMLHSWFPTGVRDEFHSWVYNAGTEYWYGTDLNRLGSAAFGLRAGYWRDIAGHITSITYGASVKISTFVFDFSYETAGKNHPITDTMRFSLAFEM